jgi:hypothetical protein
VVLESITRREDRERERELLRDPRLDAVAEKRRILERTRNELSHVFGAGTYTEVKAVDAELAKLADEELRVRESGR